VNKIIYNAYLLKRELQRSCVKNIPYHNIDGVAPSKRDNSASVTNETSDATSLLKEPMYQL
jgi:hypothetical protein